jgi:hypothetical protein
MTAVTGLRTPLYMALTGPHGQSAIPRISHGQRRTAASDGIWLHVPDEAGTPEVPELVF